MILERFKSGKNGTFGKLEIDGYTFYSVEKPWNNNEPFNSCIPVGEYSLIPAKSSKYGNCLAVVNDEIGITRYDECYSERYAILIHWGNWEKDVLGCIALGDSYVSKSHMVTNSRQSIIDFYNIVDPTKVHKFTIKDI